MDHIADGLTISNITTNTTSILSTISPYLTLLLGILLALFIIKSLIDMVTASDSKEDVKDN